MKDTLVYKLLFDEEGTISFQVLFIDKDFATWLNRFETRFYYVRPNDSSYLGSNRICLPTYLRDGEHDFYISVLLWRAEFRWDKAQAWNWYQQIHTQLKIAVDVYLAENEVKLIPIPEPSETIDVEPVHLRHYPPFGTDPLIHLCRTTLTLLQELDGQKVSEENKEEIRKLMKLAEELIKE